MSSVILRKTINDLSFLRLSAIVHCEFGDVTIDVTQDGNFIIERSDIKSHTRFKNNEVDQIIGYLGVITRIMTLNHNTDEETILF